VSSRSETSGSVFFLGFGFVDLDAFVGLVQELFVDPVAGLFR
jgi:hypothetical protein